MTILDLKTSPVGTIGGKGGCLRVYNITFQTTVFLWPLAGNHPIQTSDYLRRICSTSGPEEQTTQDARGSRSSSEV